VNAGCAIRKPSSEKETLIMLITKPKPTRSTPSPPPPVNADARVVAAREKAAALHERVHSAERALYAGEHADDRAGRVSRLLADPGTSLTRTPAVTIDDLRDLRAAAAEADREVERAESTVRAEYVSATLAERRERLRDLLGAAEHFYALADEEIRIDNTEASAGYAPARVVYSADREALSRLVERIRHQDAALSA
jgi:hypothetical protein